MSVLEILAELAEDIGELVLVAVQDFVGLEALGGVELRHESDPFVSSEFLHSRGRLGRELVYRECGHGAVERNEESKAYADHERPCGHGYQEQVCSQPCEADQPTDGPFPYDIAGAQRHQLLFTGFALVCSAATVFHIG